MLFEARRAGTWLSAGNTRVCAHAPWTTPSANLGALRNATRCTSLRISKYEPLHSAVPRDVHRTTWSRRREGANALEPWHERCSLVIRKGARPWFFPSTRFERRSSLLVLPPVSFATFDTSLRRCSPPRCPRDALPSPGMRGNVTPSERRGRASRVDGCSPGERPTVPI